MECIPTGFLETAQWCNNVRAGDWRRWPSRARGRACVACACDLGAGGAYVVGRVSVQPVTAACHCINYCRGIRGVQIIQNALLGPVCFTCQWSE